MSRRVPGNRPLTAIARPWNNPDVTPAKSPAYASICASVQIVVSLAVQLFVVVPAFTHMCVPLRLVNPTLKGAATLQFQVDNGMVYIYITSG